VPQRLARQRRHQRHRNTELGAVGITSQQLRRRNADGAVANEPEGQRLIARDLGFLKYPVEHVAPQHHAIQRGSG
jgi:hypothetical protein